MKYQTTQKAVRNGYDNVIAIGYCNLQYLLKYTPERAYTARREGWGADIYEVPGNNAIATGYAPFGNIRPDYETQKRYDKEAQKIALDYSKSWEEQKEEINALLAAFVEEVTK